MGDSEDEYHRRGGRDKFTRERNDYSDRSRPRDYDYDRRGGGYSRNDYTNGGAKRSSSNRRDDYSSSATTKRPRIDSTSDSYDPVIKSASEESVPTVMMTFKRFLATQDDAITDEEAIAKYTEYKMEIKRQELHKFFTAHKDEQWFRLKYHPEESGKRKEEQSQNVHQRLAIFEEMLSDGKVSKLHMDIDDAADIIRIMDTLVVKMEGGTAEDVAMLADEKIEDESLTELKNSHKDEEKAKVAEDGDSEEKKIKTEIKSEPGNDDGAISDSDGEKNEGDNNGEIRTKKKMLLHKTSSIFLRNVAPNITIQEIETVCKRFPGFLRVGLSDPLPDRKYYRRGWVTFRRDVNIKEICWNLNGVRIRDCDLGAIVNRDLARRVRSTNGITAHKQVAQNDLRQAAKLAAFYDKKAGLYQPPEEEKAQTPVDEFELDPIARSRNPLLKNLTDFLIEEANAEEEELLGLSNGDAADDNQKVSLQRDEALLEKLDHIVIYLRIVHSIDFYNCGEYPNEDVMPNRCGMMHVRGEAPPASQNGVDDVTKQPFITTKFINEFTSGFNSRLETALMSETVLSDADLVNLGKKDPEKELEAFITANSVELAKDKWLCPLSGKKFKGPEFIRKHLTSKHAEKLEEVKQETTFFNNYLADPKRPQSQEVKPPVVTTSSSSSRDERREKDVDQDRNTGRSSYGDRNRSYGGTSGRYGGGSYGRSYDRGRYYEAPAGGRRDPREPVTYKDLDAPEDIF